MPTIAIEAIVTIVMWILKWIIEKKANDKELTEAFKKFSELARTENIKAIMKRNKAENQIKAGNDKWDEIEAQEAAAKKGKK